MVKKFLEIYSQNAMQVACILKGKSQMWQMGFRNGLISSSTEDFTKRDPFLAHMAPEYELGFSEGKSYAIYKLAMEKEIEV